MARTDAGLDDELGLAYVPVETIGGDLGLPGEQCVDDCDVLLDRAGDPTRRDEVMTARRTDPLVDQAHLFCELGIARRLRELRMEFLIENNELRVVLRRFRTEADPFRTYGVQRITIVSRSTAGIPTPTANSSSARRTS